MKEVLNSIYDTYKDRLKNPFFRSFLFSWIAFNWKPLSIIIVSKDSIYHRIEVIETCYDPNWYNLIIPLAIAIAYILVLPYIMWGLDYLTKTAIISRRDIAINIQIEKQKSSRKMILDKIDIEENMKEFLEKSEANKKSLDRKKIDGVKYDIYDYNLVQKNDRVYESFGDVTGSIKSSGNFPINLSDDLKEYYLINDLVEEDSYGSGYVLSDKGNWIYKEYFNEKFK
jgi:hypothetical protein